MIKPRRLQKGDTIAIVSLSRGLLGNPKLKHEVDIALKRLHDYGFNVKIMPNAMASSEYLDEHPEARAQDLKDAFNDDSVAGIFTAIGGIDTFRTYEYLMEDKEFIENVRSNPKVFLGFSDTTMNHLMFYRLGLVTYYGPSIIADFAELDKDMLPYTKRYFELLLDDTKSYQIESSPIWYSDRKSYGTEEIGKSRKINKEIHGFELLNGGGVVSGILYGGCIDTIYNAYAGNRFEGKYSYEPEIIKKYKILPSIDEYKNMILFLEVSDFQPTPETLRECLLELKNRNILESVKGIIFGKPKDEKYYDEYKQVIKEVFSDLETPVLYNLNFGHSLPRCIIPYGVNATVDFNDKRVSIDEPIVNELDVINKSK